MSTIQRIVVRKGLEADVPALKEAELGYDTDTKVLRVGDDTDTPSKVLTTKSTGDFDFSTAGLITLSSLSIAAGGTLAGLDTDSMVAGTGILTHSTTTGVFSQTEIVSTDDTLLVTAGDGLSGAIDIRLHPDVITNLTGVNYLQQVVSDSSLTGLGTSASTLKVAQATELSIGGAQIATQIEADSGVSDTTILTPKKLLNLGSSSAVLTGLASAMTGLVAVSTDGSLTGSGLGGTPMSVTQATTVQLGGATLATPTIAENGVSNTTMLTPYALANITPGSVLANALTLAVSGTTPQVTTFPTSGPTQTLPTLGVTELSFMIEAIVSAPQNTDGYAVFETTVDVSMFISGTWWTVASATTRLSTGTPASTEPVFNDNPNHHATVLIDNLSGTNRVLFENGGIASGVWDGQIRTTTTMTGVGTVSGVGVSNAGSSVTTLLYR